MAYTWVKGRGGDWLVRGPAGQAGKVVEVANSGGMSSRVMLARQIWAGDGDGVALYELGDPCPSTWPTIGPAW